MKENRKPKKDDQELAQKAYELIVDLMRNNQQIEPNLWGAAIWSVLTKGYKESNFTYHEFCQEVRDALNHYESWWKDDH